MRHLIASLALILAGAASAQTSLPTIGSGGSGGFPVFGPSAEREAFFAEQEAQRREAAETLRREQAAAEAARAAAAAEAASREDEPRRIIASDVIWRPGLGWAVPVEVCERLPGIPPADTRVPTPDYPRPEAPATIIRPAPLPDRIVCRTEYRPVWRPDDPRPRTQIGVQIGPDGITGSLEYRAP
ncbi:hypothetical protein HMH01_09965 [Halovulum dunhuangense]|uniref:Uncharacterized protein n=1 Tax=Halovulum dunhuangense TaxID=1505036 RepID=A0A849L3I5_9RHOB|nr:hypothetical protein [Halovulum dunhuangense]NNU80762.1 hypothetical protein [Halovulum dunhuangense]